MPNNSYKKRVQRDLRSQNTNDYLSAWYELMVYDWLESLAKKPVPEPSIPNFSGKPDFLIESDGLQILVEVFVVQESEVDEKTSNQPRVVWTADTATFWRMGSRLREKMGKYFKIAETLNIPYVICVCLDLESLLLDMREVVTYFLGGEAYNPTTGRLNPMENGQIFERHPGESPSLAPQYLHVSALLVCRRVPLKINHQLQFGLIQNPFALRPIPQNTFGQILRYVIVSETETHYTMNWRAATESS